MIVVFTRRAAADLDEIIRYIATENPAAAGRVALRLREGCYALRDFPGRGRPGERAGTREIVIQPYVIVYRPTAAMIQILRVWHGRQSRGR